MMIAPTITNAPKIRVGPVLRSRISQPRNSTATGSKLMIAAMWLLPNTTAISNDRDKPSQRGMGANEGARG